MVINFTNGQYERMELHLSLSKYLPLKVFQIPTFIEKIESAIKEQEAFNISLCGFRKLSNEDGTKHFIVINVKNGCLSLSKLASRIDFVVGQFSQLDQYYNNPIFHVSLLASNSPLDGSLISELNSRFGSLSIVMRVDKVCCLVGKKLFRFHLK
jgi:hypothetical protein